MNNSNPHPYEQIPPERRQDYLAEADELLRQVAAETDLDLKEEIDPKPNVDEKITALEELGTASREVQTQAREGRRFDEPRQQHALRVLAGLATSAGRVKRLEGLMHPETPLQPPAHSGAEQQPPQPPAQQPPHTPQAA